MERKEEEEVEEKVGLEGQAGESLFQMGYGNRSLYHQRSKRRNQGQKKENALKPTKDQLPVALGRK